MWNKTQWTVWQLCKPVQIEFNLSHLSLNGPGPNVLFLHVSILMNLSINYVQLYPKRCILQALIRFLQWLNNYFHTLQIIIINQMTYCLCAYTTMVYMGISKIYGSHQSASCINILWNRRIAMLFTWYVCPIFQ